MFVQIMCFGWYAKKEIIGIYTDMSSSQVKCLSQCFLFVIVHECLKITLRRESMSIFVTNVLCVDCTMHHTNSTFRMGGFVFKKSVKLDFLQCRWHQVQPYHWNIQWKISRKLCVFCWIIDFCSRLFRNFSNYTADRLVFDDKTEALKMLKKCRESRLKVFQTYDEADFFSRCGTESNQNVIDVAIIANGVQSPSNRICDKNGADKKRKFNPPPVWFIRILCVLKSE